MKNLLRIIYALILFAGMGKAQVLADFEQPGSLGIFEKKNTGTLADSILRSADPTNKSAGVMKVHFNLTGSQSNAMFGLPEAAKGTIKADSAQVLTYWIFIPKNSTIPDSIQFGLFFQSTADWSWNEKYYYAVDIPKGKWFPLSYFLADSSISNPASDDISTHNLGDFGIQWWNTGNSSSAIWSGDIYIDNVTLIGAKPTIYAQFNTSIENFTQLWSNGWTASAAYNAGPVGNRMGLLEVKLQNGNNQTGGVAYGIEPTGGYTASAQNMLAFWIYLPASFPDTAYIQVFAQDNSSWAWPSPGGIITYSGKNIPKEKWYPVYFDLEQATALDTMSSGSFNHHTFPLGKFGFQVGGTTWQGSLFVDKVEFINTVIPETSVQWLAANWQFGTNGLQGFYVPLYADGSVTKVIDIVTANKSWVLVGQADFSQPKHNFAVMRDSIPLLDEQNSAMWATEASLDCYFPASMPSGALLEFVVTGRSANNKWISKKYNIDNVQIKKAAWTTIKINIDSLVNNGDIDPSRNTTLGVKVSYPAPNDTVTWKGQIFFDNLVLKGIARTNQLPAVTTGVEDNAAVVKEFRLYNNYPNPFNPSTVIRYDIAKESNVVVKIFDVLGNEAATLVNSKQGNGSYTVTFDGTKFSSGVYICRINAASSESFTRSIKLMLVK